MSRLFRDVEGGTLYPHGSVVCIGAFDGLHLGHRALVRHALARAQALGVPAVAVSFEPLPREFFAPHNPPPRLTLARAKFEGLRDLGADGVGLLRFDRKLSGLSAEDFVQRCLVQRLRAREVWIGPEFRFGHKRGGDIALLQRMGAEVGFAANQIEPVDLHGERISSTRIRELLVAGNFDHAADLLGRPYAIDGRVVRGKQLGRTLGFPTANLRFPHTPALSGHLCDLGARGVRTALAVGVELRYPAYRGRDRAAARSALVRLSRRPLWTPHRSRIRRQIA